MAQPEYLSKNPIGFLNKATGRKVTILAADVIDIVDKSNNYLRALKELCTKLDFDIYSGLGQRNLSGFVGEVFSKVFVAVAKNFVNNPHPDGRPDLLDLSTNEAFDYYNAECFSRSSYGSRIPKKALLAPFKYGGLEVKASIGIPISEYRTRLKEERGLSEFSVGIPRVSYLHSLGYWGHHTGCENMVGLYYDYLSELNGVPQILAVMYSELIPSKDWSKVSVGRAGSKKTSNTSLNSYGIEKLMKNPVVIRNNPTYLQALGRIGLNL